MISFKDLEPKKTYSKQSVAVEIVFNLQHSKQILCKFDGDESDLLVVISVDGDYFFTAESGVKLLIESFKTNSIPPNFTVDVDNKKYEQFYPFSLLVKQNETKVKVVNSTDPTAGTSNENIVKYTYTSLKEILNSKFVAKSYLNIYGVLRREVFDSNWTIHLSDEEIVDFAVCLRLQRNGPGYPVFKTGDIIRIHRLICESRNKEPICFSPANMLVFSSFNSDLKVRKTSKHFTLESVDEQRTKQLNMWFAQSIIKTSLSDLPCSGYVDIACQLINIHIKSDENIAYLCIYDGSQPNLKLTTNFPPELFSGNELFDRIDVSRCVVLTVFDIHAKRARKLTPGAYIVIFNGKVDRNMFRLHGNDTYGKRVRQIHPNCDLGKLIVAKITSSDDQIVQFMNDNEDADFQFRSSQVESDVNPVGSTTDSQLFSDASFYEGINEIPHDSGNVYFITAKAEKCFPFPRAVEDVIIAYCSICGLKSSIGETWHSKCRICGRDNSVQFALIFILKDEKNEKLIAVLEGEFANDFFGMSPAEALQSKTSLSSIVNTLTAICCASNENETNFNELRNPVRLWGIKQMSSLHKICAVKPFDANVTESLRSRRSVAVGCNLSLIE